MESITSYDYYSEFKHYALKHLGVSGMQFHYWEKLQDRIYSHNAALTPYILEERELRVTQMDIFSLHKIKNVSKIYRNCLGNWSKIISSPI